MEEYNAPTMSGKFSVTATLNLASVNLECEEEGKLRDTESGGIVDLTHDLVRQRIDPLFKQAQECWPNNGFGLKLGTGTRPDDNTRGIIYASYLTEEEAQEIKNKLEELTALNGLKIWDLVISSGEKT